MSYFKKHIFFCVNQKEGGRKCCQDAGAAEMFSYTKGQLKEMDLLGEGKVRVSHSGCLGRCKLGPCIVIYPEQVWYTYETRADIDEIIQSHVIQNKVVERLVI